MNQLKSTNFDIENLFATSDTHFYHRNIIALNNRPYDSVEEMNESLIQNWNNKVPKDGIVFHLGDFSYGNLQNNTEILGQLNGTIYLASGNHDFGRSSNLPLNFFEDIQLAYQIKVHQRIYYLSHYPLLLYPHWWDNGSLYNLYGHVHSNPTYEYKGKDACRLEYLLPHQYDVGVDNNNYTPISFLEIENIIKKQIENDKISRITIPNS